MRLRWAKGDMNCWLIWEGRQWRVLEPQLPLFLNYRKGDSVGVFPLECMGITETHYILKSLKNKNIYWQKHCYLSSNEAGSEMKYVWINGKVFLCNKFFYKLPLLSWDPGSGLQITVAHRILTNQNLLVSDEISTEFGHYVGRIFVVVNHSPVRKNENLPWVNLTLC